MHARVTRIEGTPGGADAGITNFKESVVPFAKQEGNGAILLVDRSSGKAISITLWDDEEAMRRSEEQATSLRASAAGDLGASAAPEVERYEVAVFET